MSEHTHDRTHASSPCSRNTRTGSTFDEILPSSASSAATGPSSSRRSASSSPAGDVRSLRGRFHLAAKTDVVRGRFVTARPGFGFVTPEGGGEDIFVPARHAHGALPGDEVTVVVNEQGKFGKPEGRIERILRKGRTGLLGVYVERCGAPYLQPFDSPSLDDLPLKSRGKLGPAPGMIVEADRATLAVTRVFGRPEDPGVDARVVIQRYGLRLRIPRGRPAARPRPSPTSTRAAPRTAAATSATGRP